VPQDDIMMRDLTVEENIMFAAMTRLPSSWSSDRKLAFGDYVIELLGLSEIRNSPIGDEATRGISGGQRKRVNIGIELAADPVILALDEPTSGLGASTAAAAGDAVMLELLPSAGLFASRDNLLCALSCLHLQTRRAARPCALPCAASQTQASP
jgi:ABC-type nitrate/sulfonate/bicarbonate transport system ATPase subunit